MVPKADVLELANRLWADRPVAAQTLLERASAVRDGEAIAFQRGLARRLGLTTED